MALNMTIAQVQITTIVPELNASGGLTRDAAGNIYISDFGPGNSVDSNTTVYKLDINRFFYQYLLRWFYRSFRFLL